VVGRSRSNIVNEFIRAADGEMSPIMDISISATIIYVKVSVSRSEQATGAAADTASATLVPRHFLEHFALN